MKKVLFIYFFFFITIISYTQEIGENTAINNNLSAPVCDTVFISNWNIKNENCYIISNKIFIKETGILPIFFKIDLSTEVINSTNAFIQYSIDGESFFTRKIIKDINSIKNLCFSDSYSFKNNQELIVRVVGITINNNPNLFSKDSSLTLFQPDKMDYFEIINFSADLKENKVLLRWNVISNNKGNIFAIERSKNGLDFETLSYQKVGYKNKINRDYQYIDENPLYDTSFYRLKIFSDTNIVNSYSETKAIYNKSINNLIESEPLYSEGKLEINFIEKTKESVLVKILKGNQVIYYSWFDKGQKQLIINKILDKGKYNIIIESNNISLSYRISILSK